MTREEAIWAMRFYKEKLYNGIFNQYIGAFDVAISALKEQPVVHGRWIFGTTMNREWMKCSECLVSQTPTGVFSYCPNCGARMDGGGND